MKSRGGTVPLNSEHRILVEVSSNCCPNTAVINSYRINVNVIVCCLFVAKYLNFEVFHPEVSQHTKNTGLLEMIVGVLTTCRTQHTRDKSNVFFYLIEQHSKFMLHTLQVLYM